MTNNYLIRLFPEEPFFFGGEKSFGSGDGQSYFVKSNYFPQQTGLLGLLRYQLLKENNKLNQQDQVLIGPESFSADKELQNFGILKTISPVFIQEGSNEVVNSFLPLSFDYCYNDMLEIVPMKLKHNQTGTIKQSTVKFQVPEIENYNAKNGLAPLLIESKGEKFMCFDFDKNKHDDEVNGIFIHETRIGILKDKTSQNEEDAFYRQEYLNLQKGFSFSFFVNIDHELTNDLVWFGKEKTFFRMVVSKPDTSFEELFTKQTYTLKNNQRSGQVILTSDAFATNDLLKVSNFSINETIDFRNIQTPANVLNYAALDLKVSHSQEFRFRSDKYQLFKRGSVFWGDTGLIAQHLENNNFQQIGYNRFITF